MHCNLPARTPRPRPDRCHASAGWLPALLCCLLLVRPTYYDSTIVCTLHLLALLVATCTADPRNCSQHTAAKLYTVLCAVNMPDSQLPAAGCCCCRCVPVPAMLLLLQRSEHRNRGRRLRCAHAAACGATRGAAGVRRPTRSSSRGGCCWPRQAGGRHPSSSARRVDANATQPRVPPPPS
jgi:hypothetical protein